MGASLAEDMAVAMFSNPSLAGGGKKCQRYLTGKLTWESFVQSQQHDYRSRKIHIDT